MSKSSTWPTEKCLSDAFTPDHSEPGSDGNGGVHHIIKSAKFPQYAYRATLTGEININHYTNRRANFIQ